MEEFVRGSCFHQPSDCLDSGEFRYAAVDQRVKMRTDAPRSDHGNTVDELRCQFVFSQVRKDGMCDERMFFFQALELIEEHAALGTPQVRQVQNPNVPPSQWCMTRITLYCVVSGFVGTNEIDNS